MSSQHRIKWIGQQARQEWQRSHRKSWNKTGKYNEQKIKQNGG